MKNSIKAFVVCNPGKTLFIATNGTKSALISISGTFYEWYEGEIPKNASPVNFSYILVKAKRDAVKAKIAAIFI